MTSEEMNQHEQAADAATSIEPCDGQRALNDLIAKTHDELFSLEAIRGQCDRFNRTWMVLNGVSPR